MDKLFIIKIGGNVIDDDACLKNFLKKFSKIKEKKILIHGGGKLATIISSKLGIEQKFVNGRRITDFDTLEIATMVYGGLINKKIISILQAETCNSLGVTGVDLNLILAKKRTSSEIDFGFVGDIVEVNSREIQKISEQGVSLVVAPITHDGAGQLLNTNADTIAKEISIAMNKYFDVELIYLFEKDGVLKNFDDENSVIDALSLTEYEKLKSDGKIFSGMLPKLENIFSALSLGLKNITIGNADKIEEVISGNSGTKFIL